jgi:hypothetical protein
MFSHLKDLIIGPALPSASGAHRQLNKIRALAAFSPDALSSIAYANQEIYLGLVVAGSAGLAESGLAGPLAACRVWLALDMEAPRMIWHAQR